jgi:co-chaperonin GroES (HSP10)
MVATLVPANDKILLDLLAPTKPKSDQIIIPDTAKELSLEFRVIALGPGTDEKPRDPELEVGQRVIVGPFGAVELKHADKTYYLAPMEQVLAIIKD